jgi:hypothetical protein
MSKGLHRNRKLAKARTQLRIPHGAAHRARARRKRPAHAQAAAAK